jgi:hypothetical protein
VPRWTLNGLGTTTSRNKKGPGGAMGSNPVADRGRRAQDGFSPGATGDRRNYRAALPASQLVIEQPCRRCSAPHRSTQSAASWSDAAIIPETTLPSPLDRRFARETRRTPDGSIVNADRDGSSPLVSSFYSTRTCGSSAAGTNPGG